MQNATKPAHVSQRFIRIGRRRTSVRLEESLWLALQAIARAEGKSVNELCTDLHATVRRGTYTSALRVFIVEWMRTQCRLPGQGAAEFRPPAPPVPDRARPGP